MCFAVAGQGRVGFEGVGDEGGVGVDVAADGEHGDLAVGEGEEGGECAYGASWTGL